VFQYSGASLDSVLVNLLDTIKPNLALKADTVFLNNPTSSGTINFGNIDNGSSDNCALDSATLNGVSQLLYTCADTGSHLINTVLWDSNGNTSFGSVTVYVLDTVTPGYTKTPYTANLIGDSAIVKQSDLLSNATGGCFPPKVTLLSDTVFYCSDISLNPHYVHFQITGGNLDSVEVTVADTTAPTTVLKNYTLYLNTPNSSDTVSFLDVNKASYDNCGIDTATLNGSSELIFTCADTGVNHVQVLLWDINGNSQLDTSVILVMDTSSVTYTKSSAKVYLGYAPDTVSRADFVTPAIAGCYAPALTIFSDTIFDCTDIANNPSFIVFQYDGADLDSIPVLVYDTLRPNINLQSDTFYIKNLGGDTIFFNDIDSFL